jgi:nitrogen fixation protein NifB
MTLDLSRHPCFNKDSRHEFGRIHLPVAPKCNIQCNFCDRKFDCANESRPGVTSAVLSPEQALHYLHGVMEKSPRIAVVGIAGPGDPFANAEETLRTLRLVRENYPEMLLCVATNGLALPPHAAAMAELDVSHVTITINAVDPDVGAKIYAWIREPREGARNGFQVYRGREGAERLLLRQLKSIEELKRLGVTVKVNTIVIPGVNDHHVGDVAKCVADLGADILNCVPLYPVAGTPFESIAPLTTEEVAQMRGVAAEHLPQMHHCTRCRADAVGMLGTPMSDECRDLLKESASLPIVPDDPRPCVAVATREGALVNQHLGEAEQLAIYRQIDGGFELVEQRDTPRRGSGDQRWQALASSLKDCRAVLVASAGQSPTATLKAAGVQVVMMEGLIEEGLEAVFQGKEVRAPLRREHRCGAGAACAGNGMGCM